MTACPSCGSENREGARFCDSCGNALAAAAAEGKEERKVVSVLFCDLVGFTAASESADPEDVRARLRPYHRRLRERIEAFGGTVEKFVGDAVMAVFGAPVAHEDDAERAVRAGLAILESLDEMNEKEPELSLSVRIGVNTGEALVALDARPEAGEGFVTGDVVNTAARIQAAAPVGGVAVGEGTFRATEPVFEWEELPAGEAKGKNEPVRLWRALAARARFGSDVIRRLSTPLVGREVDMLQLRAAFEKSSREPSTQLVTVVGEPGVGKSRLVAELTAHVDALPGLVRWRQGRCLPYGDGIAFWALGEIAKAQLGVYESDSPTDAEAKLDRLLPAAEDTPWLKARLLPLLGIDPGVTATRDESFTAWRRFLESIAESEPAVLVFEDLHWADEALLDFLEYLADWAQGVPLLVLCSARPELLERRPTWAAGLRNATTISLAPLSDREIAELIGALLEQAVLPAGTQQLIQERAGGNPLYAEEFVRMLRDRGLVDSRGALVDGADVPFPDSLQALIAARLDTLSTERKGLLQDAAVIGKVFWAGAVAAMGERDARDVEVALHELARKELVRPSRQSSMEGEQELGFWHALVRDVAYGQIPRAQRAAKHVAAARWIESKARERVEDLADVLAYHTGTAMELAEATGDAALAAEIAPAARRYALLAGERALGLDTAKAVELLERAVELTPEDDPAYADALVRFATAAFQAGKREIAAEALERAIAVFRARDDAPRTGGALTLLGLIAPGDPARNFSFSLEAAELLESVPPSPELVAAYAQLSGHRLVRGQYDESLEASGRSLELARELGLPVPARALGFHGAALCNTGQQTAVGLVELEEARALLVAEGRGRDAAVATHNLAIARWTLEGPVAATRTLREAVSFAAQRGLVEAQVASLASILERLVDAGRLDEVLVVASDLTALTERTIPTALSTVEAAAAVSRVHHERGDTASAAISADDALAAAHRSGLPIAVAIAASPAAAARLARNDAVAARELLGEVGSWKDGRVNEEYLSRLPAYVRYAIAADDLVLAEGLVGEIRPILPLHEHVLVAVQALIAEARREHAQAADRFAGAAARWEGFGAALEQAYALLGQGRCLVALGDAAARQPLRAARTLFEEMGARPRVADCDTLLTRALAAGA